MLKIKNQAVIDTFWYFDKLIWLMMGRHSHGWETLNLTLLLVLDSRYDSNIFESGITQSNTQTHGDTKHLT
jgi:hypothetical protein